MFSKSVYRRGLSYYNNGQVSDLSFDLNHDVWTAQVYGTEKYFVEVNLENLSKGSIRAYCDCPAFYTYDSCKHIVAVLLGIANKSDDHKVIDHQITNRFIDAISSTYQPESQQIQEKIPMQVEYYCKWSYEHNLYIELKTGEKRCFVVRDMQQFLENVLAENEHYFTKTFTYSPELHFFLQKDLQLFELLYSIIQNEKIYNHYTIHHYRGGNHDKRSITIPPLLVKEILEKLVERKFMVVMDNQEFKQVNIVKHELPFKFSLAKNDQKDLMLLMENFSRGIYLEIYRILFLEGTFFFPSKEQIPILKHFQKIGLENHQMPIMSEKTDTFLSEVLPALKKIGDVQITDEVASEIIQVPLRAKLFLKIKGDWIAGKLEYHYGKHTIDPFHRDEEKDVMIVRDTEKERQIMALIEEASFRYNGQDLYIDADEDELYEFLYTILPYLDDHVELFLTSDVQQLIVENEPIPSTSVRIDSSTNLLEIGFNIEGVDDEEINAILNAVIEKKRFYRMRSGALLSLEGEEFSSMKQFFQELNIKQPDLQQGHIHMPVYRGAQIDEMIVARKNYDPSFRKLLHQLKSPEEQVYAIPDNLQGSLRSYQKTGYQWFKSLSAYQLGGILADDMGLGKTIQTIAYILSEPNENPHLIVVPSSVVYNWKNEFHQFAPDLTVEILTGTPNERKKKVENCIHKDIWITSYATLRQDIELYKELTFQTLILDEAQFIKNYATKTSQAIRKIKAGRRFALSGTPIENSIDELWAIFQVVLPGLMPSQHTFRQLPYEKIAMLTKPFILRRVKAEVLKELPEKIESIYVSELTNEQKQLYIGYLRQVQQEATDSIEDGGFHKSRMKILAGLTRLRQICCHPSLFMENYDGNSGKLQQLLDTVQTSILNGKRMLIFSQFTSMHEIIIEQLNKRSIDYFYLHGQTPSEDRVRMSDRFNQGEKDVFLISLRAGGTGLNLTGADTVILYDLWWNPAVEDQATGRAHRFGQKNVVQVIRLVTEGTIEEKIYELQQKKRELIDQVVQPGETMLSSLTEEDIRELLNM